MTTAFGVVCTLSVFLPVCAIMRYRLYLHRSLAALCISYISTGIYNLMSADMIPVPKSVVTAMGVLTNYLDAPLMLFALLFFCPSRQNRRPAHMLTALLLVYSLVIGIRFGFSRSSIVYVLGPGLLMILAYSAYLFARQVRFTVARGKNIGRMLMLAAILFAYGSYGFMYVFYYMLETKNVDDIFLLYHITTLISCMLMTSGLLLTRRRFREFQEVTNTRRELAVFFGQPS